MSLIDQPVVDPEGGGEPAKKDPRQLPHTDIDDPRKAPPAKDPEIRKGPLDDPKPLNIGQIDPVVHKEIVDPPAPGAPEAPMQA